jgi:hypothetical protein
MTADKIWRTICGASYSRRRHERNRGQSKGQR